MTLIRRLRQEQKGRRAAEAGSGSRTCICGIVCARPSRWTIPRAPCPTQCGRRRFGQNYSSRSQPLWRARMRPRGRGSPLSSRAGPDAGVLSFADDFARRGMSCTPGSLRGQHVHRPRRGRRLRQAGRLRHDPRARSRLREKTLPDGIVYAGVSLGVMPAQMLAQTRPGTKGALLFSAALPPEEFGGPWPEGVPVQIHMMEADEWGRRRPPRRPPNRGDGRERGAVPVSRRSTPVR